MNLAFLVLAFLATVNPARARSAFPERNLAVLASGALVVLGAGAGLAAVASDVLSALDISPETFQIAAGLIIGLWGLWAMVVPPPGRQPALTGWGASVVPVVFPILLTPPLAALLIATAAIEPIGEVIAALAVALAAAVAYAAISGQGTAGQAFAVWAARLLAAVMVVVAVTLMVYGIRDV